MATVTQLNGFKGKLISDNSKGSKGVLSKGHGHTGKIHWWWGGPWGDGTVPCPEALETQDYLHKHFQCREQKAGSGSATAPVTVSQWPIHIGTGALLERCVSREQQPQWMP